MSLYNVHFGTFVLVWIVGEVWSVWETCGVWKSGVWSVVKNDCDVIWKGIVVLLGHFKKI